MRRNRDKAGHLRIVRIVHYNSYLHYTMTHKTVGKLRLPKPNVLYYAKHPSVIPFLILIHNHVQKFSSSNKRPLAELISISLANMENVVEHNHKKSSAKRDIGH